MTATGGDDQPAEPSALHSGFSEHHPLKWGDRLPTAAHLIAEYGADAARLTLSSLQRRIRTEPRTTADFLAALPEGSRPYNLDSRVKSPMSLARQFQNRLERDKEGEPGDVLRYTVLCRTPSELVAVAKSTVDRLRGSGWEVTAAMHSYTEGSRYKGLHAELRTPAGDTVEVQFHSVASVKIKEATTRPYEIERSAAATDSERAAGRALCVKLSGTLVLPSGMNELRTLGGGSVIVNNYSDSRAHSGPAVVPVRRTTAGQQTHRQQASGRQIDGTGR